MKPRKQFRDLIIQKPGPRGPGFFIGGSPLMLVIARSVATKQSILAADTCCGDGLLRFARNDGRESSREISLVYAEDADAFIRN
jgi:hypothetical protein